jgi:hypothetical protein
VRALLGDLFGEASVADQQGAIARDYKPAAVPRESGQVGNIHRLVYEIGFNAVLLEQR